MSKCMQHGQLFDSDRTAYALHPSALRRSAIKGQFALHYRLFSAGITLLTAAPVLQADLCMLVGTSGRRLDVLLAVAPASYVELRRM